MSELANQINAFVENLKREGASEHTVTAYGSDLAQFLEDQKYVHHACEVESSMMMVVAPDTVKHDRLGEAFGMLNGDPRKAFPANRFDSFKELTPTGVVGDARRANADKGNKLLAVCAQGLAATLKNREMWG